MDKKWKLIDRLEPLVNQGYMVHGKYDTGDVYEIDKIGSSTLKITLKNKYFDNKIKQWNYIAKKVLDRTFRNLIKEVNAETIYSPVQNELGYEDSLRWLYNHYMYGETDGSNCVLSSNERILGIQWNGCKETSFIRSNGVTSIPNYVVLNNSKRLEGEYTVKDFETLIPTLEREFSLS